MTARGQELLGDVRRGEIEPLPIVRVARQLGQMRLAHERGRDRENGKDDHGDGNDDAQNGAEDLHV